MIRPLTLAVTLVFVAGCSPMSMLSSLLPSGGTSIDAQAGKHNEQTTGLSMSEDRIDGETVTVTKAEKFAAVTATEFIHDESVPFWVWVLVIMGWILPSPIEIWRGLGSLATNIRDFFR